MDTNLLRDFAQRCRTLMRASPIKATRRQLRMWADELEQQAANTERDLARRVADSSVSIEGTDS